jgi:hypothetical protein
MQHYDFDKSKQITQLREASMGATPATKTLHFGNVAVITCKRSNAKQAMQRYSTRWHER